MSGRLAAACWLAAAVLAGFSATAQAVPPACSGADATDPSDLDDLGGKTVYELASASSGPTVTDINGDSWTVGGLSLSIDFDEAQVVLEEFEFILIPSMKAEEVTGGQVLEFSGGFSQTLELGSNSLAISSDTMIDVDPDPDERALVTFTTVITGCFLGNLGESIHVDFLVNTFPPFEQLFVASPETVLVLGSGEPAEDPLAQLVQQRNAGEPEPALREGDAINAATGNLYRSENDIPEVTPSGLHFTRHYNSRSPLAGARGWTHTYSASIQFDVPGLEQGVLLIRPDGEGLLFYDRDETMDGVDLVERPAEIPADVPDDAPIVGTAQFPLEWTGSAWKFLNEDGALEYYSDSGQLQRIVRRNGFTQTVERDGSGRIKRVIDDSKRTLMFQHDADGRLSQLTDPAGTVVTYGYDSDGRLTDVHRQGGTVVRTYQYGAGDAPADSLTGITDENRDDFATWEYDTDNRVVVGERADGAGRIDLEYISSNETEVTLPEVNSFSDGTRGKRTYSFERIRGKVLPSAIEGDICNDCGKARAWEYNDLGLPTEVTDPRGATTQFSYAKDESGNRVSTTDALGNVTEFKDHDFFGQPRKVIHPDGLEIDFKYDDRGRMTERKETDPETYETRTTTWTYGTVPARLEKIDGPRTDVKDVTTFEYDGDGNRTSTTNALGHTTRFENHDAFGRPQKVTDPNVLVTRVAYDERGRLLSREVGGEVTTFTYDGVGNRTSVTRPDGSELVYTYDDAHRLVAVEDEKQDCIEYELDEAGNRVKEAVFDGPCTGGYGMPVRSVKRTFDALGRVTEVTNANDELVETHEYDPNGNRIETVDYGSVVQTTEREFDALDRLKTVTHPGAIMGGTSFKYDERDRITKITNPRGDATDIVYNAFGDRTKITSPDNGKTTFEYDAAGNVIARVDGSGRSAEHEYDALNRRTSSAYSDGLRVDYVHDRGKNGIGRLVRIKEFEFGKHRVRDRHKHKGRGAHGHDKHARGEYRAKVSRHGTASGHIITEWRYDRHGRVIEHRQRIPGRHLVTRHEYGPAGRRLATTYPSGATVTFGYGADELIGINLDGAPVVADASYEPFGPVSGWHWGDGEEQEHQRTFDGNGRLKTQTLANDMPPRELTYFPDGTVSSISGPRLKRKYTYDGLDRLTEASDMNPPRLAAYTYDANGNRKERSVGDRNEVYKYEDYPVLTNRLRKRVVGGEVTTFDYDASGKLVSDGDHEYGYSARGNLVAVDGGKTAAYRYNALGQRVLKHAEQEVDFLALAEKAEAKGEALAAEAAELRDQAHEARRDAADARRRAASGRADRDRAKLRLEHAEAEARFHRRIGNMWQRISDRFAERAERLRDRIVEQARSWWQRLRNWIYRWLASIYEYLADRFAAFAEHRFAKAEAAEERAAEAQVDLARAEARLAEAERQLAEAERRAERLHSAAAEKQAAADEQFRRAAKFRRLAEKGATRSVKVRFVHDEDGQLLGRYTDSGEPLREYVYLGDIPVAVAARGEVLHVHADHRNTPRLVSEPDGEVIWSWISAPFGDTSPNEDPDGDRRPFTFNLRFPGHYFDAETGWHQAGERSYDPGIGRFVSSGAAGADAGGNPFVYRGNNPVGTAETAPGGP